MSFIRSLKDTFTSTHCIEVDIFLLIGWPLSSFDIGSSKCLILFFHVVRGVGFKRQTNAQPITVFAFFFCQFHWISLVLLIAKFKRFWNTKVVLYGFSTNLTKYRRRMKWRTKNPRNIFLFILLSCSEERARFVILIRSSCNSCDLFIHFEEKSNILVSFTLGFKIFY